VSTTSVSAVPAGRQPARQRFVDTSVPKMRTPAGTGPAGVQKERSNGASLSSPALDNGDHWRYRQDHCETSVGGRASPFAAWPTSLNTIACSHTNACKADRVRPSCEATEFPVAVRSGSLPSDDGLLLSGHRTSQEKLRPRATSALRRHATASLHLAHDRCGKPRQLLRRTHWPAHQLPAAVRAASPQHAVSALRAERAFE
jgi:hypothetical protein